MDLKRLMDDANSETVAEYIGLQIQRKGNRSYILCPGHRSRLGKDDHKIGNCILTPHGYRCFACGETVGLVQMVMEHTGCGKGEAFGMIAEAMGGKDLYSDPDQSFRKAAAGPTEKLSQEEMELMEMRTPYHCSIITENGPVSEGLVVLFDTDPERYRELLLSRAKEKLAAYERVLERYGSASAPGSHDLYDLLDDAYDESIYLSLQAELEKKIRILQGAIAKLSHQAVV